VAAMDEKGGGCFLLPDDDKDKCSSTLPKERSQSGTYSGRSSPMLPGGESLSRKEVRKKGDRMHTEGKGATSEEKPKNRGEKNSRDEKGRSGGKKKIEQVPEKGGKYQFEVLFTPEDGPVWREGGFLLERKKRVIGGTAQDGLPRSRVDGDFLFELGGGEDRQGEKERNDVLQQKKEGWSSRTDIRKDTFSICGCREEGGRRFPLGLKEETRGILSVKGGRGPFLHQGREGRERHLLGGEGRRGEKRKRVAIIKNKKNILPLHRREPSSIEAIVAGEKGKKENVLLLSGRGRRTRYSSLKESASQSGRKERSSRGHKTAQEEVCLKKNPNLMNVVKRRGKKKAKGGSYRSPARMTLLLREGGSCRANWKEGGRRDADLPTRRRKEPISGLSR